jgi:hypothetical protein
LTATEGLGVNSPLTATEGLGANSPFGRGKGLHIRSKKKHHVKAKKCQPLAAEQFECTAFSPFWFFTLISLSLQSLPPPQQIRPPKVPACWSLISQLLEDLEDQELNVDDTMDDMTEEFMLLVQQGGGGKEGGSGGSGGSGKKTPEQYEKQKLQQKQKRAEEKLTKPAKEKKAKKLQPKVAKERKVQKGKNTKSH